MNDIMVIASDLLQTNCFHSFFVFGLVAFNWHAIFFSETPRPPFKTQTTIINSQINSAAQPASNEMVNQNRLQPRPPTAVRINIRKPSTDSPAPASLVTKSLDIPRQATLLEIPYRNIQSQNSHTTNAMPQKSPLQSIPSR